MFVFFVHVCIFCRNVKFFMFNVDFGIWKCVTGCLLTIATGKSLDCQVSTNVQSK